MVMTSDETQIQIFADWPMSHAKLVTKNKRKNPEHHTFAAIRKLRTDRNCPAERSWPNHIRNEQHPESALHYPQQGCLLSNIMKTNQNPDHQYFLCLPDFLV